MLHPAVRSLIPRYFRPFVRVACAALLLMLSTQAKTSASTSQPPGCQVPLTASPLAGFPASDANESGPARIGVGTRKPSIGTASFATAASGAAGTIEAPVAETAAGAAASLTAIEGARAPDWSGVWRDTGILFGSQVVAVGVIYVLPESVSGWSDEQKDKSLRKYSENVGHPVLDSDDFYVNYLLHPYWGATYYARARERGLDKIPAFVYSTLISAMFEFGIESFFEKPSIQDLIATPVAGSLLGAFVFEPLRESIKHKQELRWYDEAILVVTDPIGVLSSGFERMFGIKSHIRLDYSFLQLQKLSGVDSHSGASSLVSKSNRMGIRFEFPLN